MSYVHISGKSIYYEVNGKGEALLLLQGNTAASIVFFGTGDIQYFSENHCVITLDFNGTGKSSRMETWPVDWYAQAADDAYAVLNQNGIDQVKVIGSSGGALIGLWLAIKYPEMVSHLIADSFTLDYANQMPDIVKNTRRNYSPDQMGFWQHCHGEDWQKVIDADTDFLLRYAELQSGNQVDIPVENIRCPVMITGSKADDMVATIAEQAEITASRINRSRVYIHDSGSHPFMWSEPQAFREQAQYFWK